MSPAVEYARFGAARLVGEQEPGGLETILHLQPLQRPAQMGVDRVAGDAEFAADLFGVVVLDHEPQALSLPGAEQLQAGGLEVHDGVHLDEVNQTLCQRSSHRRRA